MNKAIGAIEMDHAELTVRLLERGLGLQRPKSQTAKEVLEAVRNDAQGKPVNEKVLDDFEQMAAIAVKYFAECAADIHLVN